VVFVFIEISRSTGSTGKRSRTTYEGLRALDQDKRNIEFLSDGTPSGPNASKFYNYIAMIDRDRVPITIMDWRLVDDHDKNLKTNIWNEIKV
jgi:hypothetical protein